MKTTSIPKFAHSFYVISDVKGTKKDMKIGLPLGFCVTFFIKGERYTYFTSYMFSIDLFTVDAEAGNPVKKFKQSTALCKVQY